MHTKLTTQRAFQQRQEKKKSNGGTHTTSMGMDTVSFGLGVGTPMSGGMASHKLAGNCHQLFRRGSNIQLVRSAFPSP